MAEYIERDKAKEELLSWARCIKHPEHLMTEDAMCVLDSIPVADVVEVKHGWWVMLPYIEPYKNKCSNCEKGSDLETDYCPNCGAKMDLEENNATD